MFRFSALFTASKPMFYHIFTCLAMLEAVWSGTGFKSMFLTLCTFLALPVALTSPSDNTTHLPLDWDEVSKEECEDLGGILIGSGCDTPHYSADVFFFSCLLFIFTFGLSFSLKNFRNTRFFPNKVSICRFITKYGIKAKQSRDILLDETILNN